jgi:hypothetical protein
MKWDLDKENVKTGLVDGDEAVNWAIEEYKRSRFRYSRKTKCWIVRSVGIKVM